MDFNVVEGGAFFGVRGAFDADGVAGAEGHAGNATAGRGVGVGFGGGEMVVGEPGVDELIVDQDAESCHQLMVPRPGQPKTQAPPIRILNAYVRPKKRFGFSTVIVSISRCDTPSCLK